MAGAAETNVALFAACCEGMIEVAAVGRLCELEETVLTAADRYNLAVDVRFG